MDGIEYMMENSKLVTFSNGCLQLHETTLQTSVNQINPEYGDLPVAVLSVIGPPRSGKSFYSNLLIKFLQNRSDDWLTDLSSDGSLPTESLHGFAFGDVTVGNIVPPTSESGIYIWPRPLITRKYGGQLLLFILHFHESREQSELEEATYFLQLLLSLLCSRITEIKWSINKFSGFDFNANESPITGSFFPKSMMCRSIVNLNRVLPHPLVHSQVSKEDMNPRTVDERTENLGEYVSSYKEVYIDESNEPMHNLHGTLDITASIHSQLDHAIKTIGDCNHTFPKLDENSIPVTLSGIQKYFRYCVSIVNECIKSYAQTQLVKSQVSEVHGKTENNSLDNADTDMASLEQGTKELDTVGNANEETASRIRGDAEITNLDKGDKEKASLEQSNTQIACLEQEIADIDKILLLKEQKRKKDEEKFFESVEDAIMFFEQHLENELDLWLKETLDIPTIKLCEGLYERCIAKTIEIKLSENSSNDEIQKMEKLVRERTEHANEKVEKIYKIVSSFHMHVQNLMQSKGFIHPEIFPKELCYKITDLEEDVKKCAQLGCSKLAPIYVIQNESIVDYESRLLLTACQDFRKVYNEKMSETTTMYHYSPKQIIDLHYELLILCVQKFRSIYRYTDTFIGFEIEKELNNHLTKDYETYKHQNLQKLKKLETKTTQVISKQKAAYCSQMESILLQSPNGIPVGTFETQHFTIMNDGIKTMKSELYKAIGKLEQTHGSVKVLMSHINLFWANFNRLNSEKLNNPKGEILVKSSSTQEQNVDVNATTLNSRKNSFYSKLCSKNTFENLYSSNEQTQLSPIIFTLSLSKIGAYILYKNKLRTFGSSGTTVGVTADDLLVSGNDITSELDQSRGSKVWKLSDYLLPIQNIETQETLTIEETPHPISTELLLGFILYSLKHKVERECRGTAAECVITIPFWLTSTQRKQIKDSGKSAGFFKTHLINENSAAALQYCQSKYDQGVNDIVILSENSGSVDSTIYSYDNFHQVVKMTGYASFYDYKHYASSESHTEKASLIGKIKEAYNNSQKMADSKLGMFTSSKEKTVIVSSESDVWKEILLTVGKGIEKASKVEGLNESLIIKGAVFLSEHTKFKREKMKDWISASIFRKSDTQKEKIIQAKKDCIVLAPQQEHWIRDTLNSREEEIIYYQKDITGKEIEIGRLKRNTPDSQTATFYLEISKESIINVSMKQPSISKGTTWYQQGLNETQLTVYLSLFESFDRTKKQLKERHRKKHDLLNHGNGLLQRIENTVFRSSLAKDMALTQIKESLDLLKHPKITTKEIDKQLENFQKYEAKLCPK